MSDKVWFHCWNSTTKNGQWHCQRHLDKENEEKWYLSHLLKYYVSERSFYKIHASESLPLNYAFVKSVSNFIWSDVIFVTIRNTNFWQQTENNSDPWHSGNDVICMSDSWPITQQLWKDLTDGQSLGSFEKIYRLFLHLQNLLLVLLRFCRNIWRPII